MAILSNRIGADTMLTWRNWEESTWDNIRGLRVIGWHVSLGCVDEFTGETLPTRCHPLARTGKSFEVAGYFEPDQDKILLLRELGTQSARLFEVHFSHLILGNRANNLNKDTDND